MLIALTRGRLAAALCLLVAAASLELACGDDGSLGVGSQDVNADDDGLEIEFPRMYSAYGGSHEYKIPARVDGVRGVEWSASPEGMVDLDKQADGSVLITTKKAGEVTIRAKKGNISGTAKLTISSTSDEDWEFGNQRYNNGVTGKRERGDGGAGGGKRDGGGGGGGWKPNPSLACTNCHARGKDDVEHTPMQTGGYSDDDLIMIFSEGKKPAGVEQRIMPADKWERIHKWSMTDDEKKGLVTYLRGLEPQSQGPTDFGGGRRGGGGGGGRRDGGSK